MAPAPPRPVVDLPAHLAAARARRPATSQRHPDSDAGRAEQHIDDTRPRQREQAVECGGDPHAVLPRSLSFRHPAACRIDGRAGPSTPARVVAKAAREKEPASEPLLRLKRSTQTTGDPQIEAGQPSGVPSRVLLFIVSALVLGFAVWNPGKEHFQVTRATVLVKPFRYKGQCPKSVTLVGRIRREGQGKVRPLPLICRRNPGTGA
jgi:hypothetical protein